MTTKSVLFCLLSCATLTAWADDGHLEGFDYGTASAPTGQEWQSPELLGYNKLQPRATFSSFATEEEARKYLPENSSWWQSLDGQWKFCFSKNPDTRPADFWKTDYDVTAWDDIAVPGSWNIQGVQRDGTLKYGVPIYVNQWVIFKYNIAVDDWRQGVMREPPKDYTTYDYRNEVGSYKRTFSLPESWNGRETFISFDGVDSFFYLWVNGQYVGFSKNSRDAARFDITSYVHSGDNQVAVEVYRSSDGSFLEAQDMFRLPGIFRTVAVYSTPKVHIRDLVVKPSWADGAGSLDISAAIENLSQKDVKQYKVVYDLYENQLYGDVNTFKQGFENGNAIDRLAKGGETRLNSNLSCDGVKPWTPEEPNVYTLVAKLQDKKGRTVETVSVQTGFRTVAIKDTPASEDEFGLAGRYFFINGKTLKLKGVNRHETNPARGHAITRDQMKEEVMMMKRANINHVRTSHYPNDPYFYYLCNKYGIALESEANIESHEYFYGKESLSHPKEWRKAHVARVMEMAHSLVNEPSIVIWSLGNEAGPGRNFKAAYDTLKTFDTTRPVQYERNNDIVDMGSNQYPTVAWVKAAVKGTMGIKYPFHISEYAHSMGNAVGNLQDYWDAIESTNYFMGGAIWDWIDQSMYNYTKDGKRYLAYGGDFGDTPNDGQFVMNGIIFGDMEPKPQYYEVKKVYQNVAVSWADKAKNTLDVFNKNYYTDDLSGYDVTWRLLADGVDVKGGILAPVKVQPRSHTLLTIDGLTDGLDAGKDYQLIVSFRLKQDEPWAGKGYVQAEQQLEVQKAAARPALAATAKGGKLTATDNPQTIDISGDGFQLAFDKATGSIQRLAYGGKQVFMDGCGPKLDAFRAWVNNDNWAYGAWYENGLYNLQHKALDSKLVKNSDGTLSVKFTVESQGVSKARLEGADKNWKKLVESGEKPDFKFTTNVIYTVYPDGSVENQSSVTASRPNLTLARLGYVMKLPKALSHMKYYGRGPIDNYPDRKTAQNIALYDQKDVANEFENFPKPQDMANHQDSRWTAFSDGQQGVLFVTDSVMSFSVLPNTDQELAMANHPHELPSSTGTWLHLDRAITGLGGNSCGQGAPLEPDRVKSEPQTFGFAIRPLASFDNGTLCAQAHVSLTAEAPLTITRDHAGNVSITGNTSDVYYKVNGGKKLKRYTEPFNLYEGGTVTAFQQGSSFSFSQKFERMENVPVTVKFASSIESGEGDAEHMVDGDPSTYWHTMYSVTVANYPHWFDIDCGTVKTLKGFTYLPRQDSGNGNIKEWRVQVSDDGDRWSDPVAQGSFENTRQLKRVLFDKPVKARYLRFTALSSQDGQDFATCAEFTVLE